MKKNITLYTSFMALSYAVTSGVYAGGVGDDREDGSTTPIAASLSQTDTSEVVQRQHSTGFVHTLKRWTVGWLWDVDGNLDLSSTNLTYQSKPISGDHDIHSILSAIHSERKKAWNQSVLQEGKMFLAENNFSEAAVIYLLLGEGWLCKSNFNSIKVPLLEAVEEKRTMTTPERDLLVKGREALEKAKSRASQN